MKTTTIEKVEEALRKQLDAAKDRLLHPEAYDPVNGAKLYRHQQWRKPLEPRYRLTTRLELLCMLKRYETELMKEILADEESTRDAKASKWPPGASP